MKECYVVYLMFLNQNRFGHRLARPWIYVAWLLNIANCLPALMGVEIWVSWWLIFCLEVQHFVLVYLVCIKFLTLIDWMSCHWLWNIFGYWHHFSWTNRHIKNADTLTFDNNIEFFRKYKIMMITLLSKYH